MNRRKEKTELANFIEEELGALLRAGREDKGWTREYVAARLGTTAEEIKRIEMRRGRIALGMVQKYAELLDKKVSIRFFS